ncbi:MAG: response regulator [Myxococcales bacterium]|nr:response regulator [Myxococcales bacterium]MCB9582662.1 response regulator [Polyangiaceae bacterium]
MPSVPGSPPPGPPREGPLDVVVVDDDARWRELAAQPFRKRGDRVRTTADGLAALAMCVEDPPDVILTDVQMPRMDGWQLLRLVRARPELASVPVVFLTSLDGDAERLRGYQLGVDAYLPKPFNPDELLIRVRRLVRKSIAADAELGKSGLRGELEHVAPASLLGFLEIEKKTGVLLLVGASVVRIFIRDGRALRAELEGRGPRHGSRAVVLSILDWNAGQFEFTEQAVNEQDELGTSISNVLLEHARIADERAR